MSLTAQIAEMQKIDSGHNAELTAAAIDQIYGAVFRDSFGRPDEGDAAGTLDALNDLEMMGVVKDKDAYLKKVAKEVKQFIRDAKSEITRSLVSDDAAQAERDEIEFTHFAKQISERLRRRALALRSLKQSPTGSPVGFDVEERLKKLLTESDREALQATAQANIESTASEYEIGELSNSFWQTVRKFVSRSPVYDRRLGRKAERNPVVKQRQESEARIVSLKALVDGKVEKTPSNATLISNLAKSLGVVDPVRRHEDARGN